MGRFVNPDNSAFQAALNAKIYVDKTGLIEYTNSVLESTDAYICNSRPRRIGKSYAANMLAAYYSRGAASESMFLDLEIGKSEDFKTYLNRYDVITYLIHLGYLAYDQKKSCAFIPNEEIRQEFLKAVRQKKWNEWIEFEK